MAGAYLTIGAKYRPFSYEELIRPVAMATEMHNKIDEQYAALQEKAGVWENLANKETDPESYKKYKDYSDSLKARAEDLAKNGLNPQSMRDMLNLRARYSSDIVPLEQAYTRRRQLADEQRKMIMQNPTLKFERDMNTTSLDDFVKNPELDYGYSVNGAMVAKQAGEAFSHLAKAIMSEPEYKHILNNNYFQSMLRSGYTPQQILALAKDSDDAPAELKAISQQVYDSTGVEDFIKENYPNIDTDENQAMQAAEWRDYVKSYINQGAWSAVGTTNYGQLTDPDAAFRKQLALANARAKHSSTKSGSGGAEPRRRTDKSLYGTKGKKNGSREVSVGTIDIRSTEDERMILDKLANAYSGSKTMDVVTGYNTDGSIKTTSEKWKKFDESNTSVTGIQIDYSSGDMYVTVREKGTNTTESIRIPNNSNTLDLETQQRVNDALEDERTARVALSRGIISQEEFEETEEYVKDVLFAALNTLLEYSGGLNVNADAGAKRSAANDASNIAVPQYTENE